MKKIRLKYAIAEFDGTLYELSPHCSHPQEIEEQIILTQRPQEPSEAQKAQRQHFKEATAYAKAALADPAVRALYEEMAQQQGKRPRGVAMADYLSGNNLLSRN